MEIRPQKSNKPKYTRESLRVIGIAFELGFIIALPIVALGLAGKWLDSREHTWFYMYIGIALAIFASSVWMFARFKSMVETARKASESAKNKTVQGTATENTENIKKE